MANRYEIDMVKGKIPLDEDYTLHELDFEGNSNEGTKGLQITENELKDIEVTPDGIIGLPRSLRDRLF